MPSHKSSFGKPNLTPVKLAERVERWQKRLLRLGVGSFRITAIHLVDETPSGPNADASVFVHPKYDIAEFWFKNEYLEDCDKYDFDCTIVHEWLHVAMRDFDGALEAVETWMPKATYADFEQTVDHEREGLIDRLARTIVGFYYNTDR